jgi:hypothetical protein
MRILVRPAGAATIEFEAVADERRSAPGLELSGLGQLQIRGTATIEGGTLVIRSVSLQAETADITTGLLRRIPVGAIREQLWRGLRQHPQLLEWETGGFIPDEQNPFLLQPVNADEQEAARRQTAQLVAGLKKRAPKRGRGARSEHFYRDLAEAYLRLLAEHPRTPVQALTEELRTSRRHQQLSRNTVAAWIRKARQQGWLTAGSPGKAGADPGPLLLAQRTKTTHADPRTATSSSAKTNTTTPKQHSPPAAISPTIPNDPGPPQ